MKTVTSQTCLGFLGITSPPKQRESIIIQYDNNCTLETNWKGKYTV